MLMHGWEKVVHPGSLHQFALFVVHLGMPAWLGYVAAFTELLGGAALILGFFTLIAASAIAIDMAVAVLRVHLHNGLTGWNGHPGFEFPLSLVALALFLIADGPGWLAIDRIVFHSS
jgi:putative oxidoreductase